MSRTVTIQLPDSALERFQRGAAAAGKDLEQFLADRLLEALPSMSVEAPSELRDELQALETVDDKSLQQVAQSQLPHDEQRQYERLAAQQADHVLSVDDQQKLHRLGEQARRLALKKAHASMLLKWRGHVLPTREELSQVE